MLNIKFALKYRTVFERNLNMGILDNTLEEGCCSNPSYWWESFMPIICGKKSETRLANTIETEATNWHFVRLERDRQHQYLVAVGGRVAELRGVRQADGSASIILVIRLRDEVNRVGARGKMGGREG